MKRSRLTESFKLYTERLQDLLNNPKNENLSNEEIGPLIEENEKVLLTALLQDEQEVIEVLKDEEVFISLVDFFVVIQRHFKSKGIAEQLEKSFKLIEKGSSLANYSQEFLEYISVNIEESNKEL